MSSARNASSVRVTRTPPRVTDSARLVPGTRAAETEPFGCAGPPAAAGSACPAGSTWCSPTLGPVPGREKRPPLPGDLLWSLRARTSHRLRGGATTGFHAWRNPTGGPVPAPAPVKGMNVNLVLLFAHRVHIHGPRQARRPR